MANVYANTALFKHIQYECQESLDILGRGMAKTSGIHAWDQRKKALEMPGSKGLFVHETYQQALTQTVPSLIGGLRRLGIIEGIHFVIGKADKKLGFKQPIEPPQGGWENIFHFRTGRILQIISLEVKGAAIGINSDDISGDEVKQWNRERYELQILPTMRANESLFGHLTCHWSVRLTTSMPDAVEGKWLLKMADDAIDPKRPNGKKLQLIEHYLYDKVRLLGDMKDATKTQQQRIMRDVNRIEKKIAPLRFGTLYVNEASSLDNLSVLTERYIRRMYKLMDPQTFRNEILNERPKTVDKCFYPDIDIEKHTYPHAFNNNYLEGLNWDFKKAKQQTCLQDEDCKPTEPLHFCIDWGTNINACTVGHHNKTADRHIMNPINSLFVKWPKGIDDLVDLICEYYRPHHNKDYFLHHDPKTGWERRPNNKMFPTFADQFMSGMAKKGWNCVGITPKGSEMPTHATRYALWKRVLGGREPGYPTLMANKTKCNLTLNSMLNTPVVEDHRGISKGKKSEDPKNGIDPEDATHFGDTMDIWLIDILRGVLRPQGQYVDLNNL